ncbi:MAG TPA: hypothetical protein PKJ19_06495 [Flavobacteriales bacterium]|nr:hypothetical protein [Flavobacteriales bacterium]
MATIKLKPCEKLEVECGCEASSVMLKSSEGTDPVVDLFEVTDGMQCPVIGIKKDHGDDYPATVMNAQYMGVTDDDFQCIILSDEFPDRKVHVKPDHSSGTPVDMPQDFTILNFKGNSITIYLDDVLAGFSAAQLKAAMTPAMRTALAAILP